MGQALWFLPPTWEAWIEFFALALPSPDRWGPLRSEPGDADIYKIPYLTLFL